MVTVLKVIGIIVMHVFFLMCLIIFSQDFLMGGPSKFLRMFEFATLIGPIAGFVFGRDFRFMD